MSDLPGVLAVDGKTLRRTHDRASHTPAFHVVCAYLGDHGLVLAEQATEDRSNEIPTVRALLKMLDLSNTIITADAMHCQREPAEQVLEQDGDYVIAVKANQPALLAKIQGYFEGAGWDRRACRFQIWNGIRRVRSGFYCVY